LAIGAATLLTPVLAPAVAQAIPTITTVASPDIPLGGTLTDQATMSGGVNTPAGTVTFRLYENDFSCFGMPVFTSDAVPLTSTYSGDGSNAMATGVCNDPAETRSVGQSTPVLTATATGDTVRTIGLRSRRPSRRSGPASTAGSRPTAVTRATGR